MPIKLDNYPLPLQQPTQKSATPFAAAASESWWQKDIQLFGNGFNAKKKKAVYEALFLLLSAGLDIQKALQLIEQGQQGKRQQQLIAQVRQTVITGSSFSDALHSAGAFSTYETVSVRIGEESGQLHSVLKELAAFFTKTVRYQQQLTGALAYPIFVSGFAVAVIFFLLKYLVPMFSGVYDRFDSELPAITQYIIAMSNWVGRYGSLVGLVLVGVVGILYLNRKKPLLRKLFSAALLRMPIFGAIIHHIYLARFCQSMSLLLYAKVSLLRAVELVKEMCAFYPLEVSLAQVEHDIMHGMPLHEALAAFSFYPPQLIALLRVGEETGQMDQMFNTLAEQYNAQVDSRTAMIGSLLEPVLIIGLGVVVGFILVAMYLPLFQMSTNVGR
ncbi:MAG: type II secretion system F family protein [Bacteroidetes bacterium]|nr:type II secretion system F family protein [Bacteroidota bacterium]